MSTAKGSHHKGLHHASLFRPQPQLLRSFTEVCPGVRFLVEGGSDYLLGHFTVSLYSTSMYFLRSSENCPSVRLLETFVLRLHQSLLTAKLHIRDQFECTACDCRKSPAYFYFVSSSPHSSSTCWPSSAFSPSFNSTFSQSFPFSNSFHQLLFFNLPLAKTSFFPYGNLRRKALRSRPSLAFFFEVRRFCPWLFAFEVLGSSPSLFKCCSLPSSGYFISSLVPRSGFCTAFNNA